MEYNILKKLIDCFNKTVSRDDLYIAVWGYETTYYNEQSINNYVRRIRVMLEKNNTGLEVCTHKGQGYELRDLIN